MRETDIAAQAAEIFQKAAAYIRSYGWQVTGMSQHGQPRCSMGALASAHLGAQWGEDVAELMYDELYKELDGVSLTEFNYRHNDGDKVARLFERVARNLCYAPAPIS